MVEVYGQEVVDGGEEEEEVEYLLGNRELKQVQTLCITSVCLSVPLAVDDQVDVNVKTKW